MVGYTGIHILQETTEGWAHLVQGDVEHLGEETDLGSSTAGRDGANDRQERAREIAMLVRERSRVCGARRMLLRTFSRCRVREG